MNKKGISISINIFFKIVSIGDIITIWRIIDTKKDIILRQNWVGGLVQDFCSILLWLS